MFMHNAAQFDAARTASARVAAIAGGAAQPPVGLLPGALVETPDGWRPVGALVPGDRIATYDGGFCPLVSVGRHALHPQAEHRSVHVPGGALDNCAPLDLMPGQAVLIAAPVVEEVLSAAAVLVPATALIGFHGITARHIDRPEARIVLRFDGEEVVYAQSGTLVHCAPEGMPAGAGFFDLLDGPRAAAMLALIAEGEAALPWSRLAA